MRLVNFLGYLSFLLVVFITALVNFLGYLSFLLTVIFILFFIVCIAMQQLVTYRSIIEKARKFANTKYLKN
jgi:hypothetical protein